MSALPAAGPHGDDAAGVAAALGRSPTEVLDLATSLNPVAPDATRHFAHSLDALRRYPDAGAATRALAAAMAVPATNLLLTNGGAEAIALVAAEVGAGEVLEPEFSLYRRHLPRVVPGAGRWRSNPHNPTGRLAPVADRAAVWDEAFYPLATGEWTRGDATQGSIVLGSLTKLFACPGLRLGYVLGDDELITRLAARQARWSVGSLACAVLPRLLETVDLMTWARQVAELRGALVGLLDEAGLHAEPSEANFVLVCRARGLRERLAGEGVVVRDCSSFGLPEAARIAVPDERGLERLATALGLRPPSRTRRTPLRGALLVCGTSSDAGKSQIVTGLCRALARRGVRVAPFKAQNMSLNSFATPSGHEIGRAQGIQALAARAVPEVAMNPILLKPTGECRSQVVVMGRPSGEVDASSYMRARRGALWPTVLEAFDDLSSRFDVVVAEGAGSAAEVNLLDSDLANLPLAEATGTPALVVGDIERGGVFASLYGTVRVVPEELARWVSGFVINKFRGDPVLLGSGIEELERRTGVPVLGVIPYVAGLFLDAEDSLGLTRAVAGPPDAVAPDPRQVLDVAVVALPHLANFTDVDALALEPAVRLRLVASAAWLGDPDLVILPGSKTTVSDLRWLQATGIAAALRRAAEQPGGTSVLGICAGYQMLGESIVDGGIESGSGEVDGLGLLSARTVFTPEKQTRPRSGRALGAAVRGYEIRQGRPEPTLRGVLPLVDLEDCFGSGPEGAVSADGRVAGTSLHGLFESDGFRTAFLSAVARRREKVFATSGVSFEAAREAQIDRLADLVEEHLDMELVLAMIATAPRRRR